MDVKAQLKLVEDAVRLARHCHANAMNDGRDLSIDFAIKELQSIQKFLQEGSTP